MGTKWAAFAIGIVRVVKFIVCYIVFAEGFIIMVWAWPLTARFENSVMATLRNALLFGGTSPFTTLAALIIPAIAIGLTVASLQWLPKGLYLLLILGFGIVVQLQIPLFEHALKPYVNKVAA